MNTRITLGAAVIVACGVMIVSQPGRAQQRPAGPYTAEQAAAGRAAYQTNCAACHAPDLSGREGPQLAGANFMSQWGDKTAGDLIGFMRATMPPGAGGSLPDQTYINLAAFILDANSARPGDRTLTVGIARFDPQRRVRSACGVLAAGATADTSLRAQPSTADRRPVESPWRVKSRTTFRSPTPCCAIPIPATGS